MPNKSGRTRRELGEALWAAAAECDVTAVTQLLAGGADPNYRYRRYSTPLSVAVSAGTTRTTHVDRDGVTVIAHDPLETARLLLEAGAEPYDVERGRRAPLISAAVQPRVLELILPRLTDIDLPTKEGQTLLMIAAGNGSMESVRLLLEHGASVNVVRHDGSTAQDAAKRFAEIVELLMEHSAKSGADLPEGRAAAERMRQKQERRERRQSSIEDRWPRPDFREAADSQEFSLARLRLRELCNGSEPIVPPEHSGFVSHKVATRKQALDLIERHRDEFLQRGCFLFATGQAPRHNERDTISILPTTDPYQAISFMGTNRNNGGGPGDVCEHLKRIEAEWPFVLDRIVFDRLEGRWLERPRDPQRMAEVLYRFCPDLVDQGVGTVAALAKSLRRSDRLYFWWD